MTYHSQIGQDKWVDTVLGGKTDGTFLDVGCGHHKRINNTHFFECERNWSGVAIDISGDYEAGWITERPRSRFIATDATKVQYESVCLSLGLPMIIDYLSLDLEPPALSLVALERVLESNRRFRCITFETDVYRQTATQEPSRDLLRDAGYTLVVPGRQDDFWVCKELV